jgi:hypothetical protein
MLFVYSSGIWVPISLVSVLLSVFLEKVYLPFLCLGSVFFLALVDIAHSHIRCDTSRSWPQAKTINVTIRCFTVSVCQEEDRTCRFILV